MGMRKRNSEREIFGPNALNYPQRLLLYYPYPCASMHLLGCFGYLHFKQVATADFILLFRMRDMPDQGNQRSIRDILGVVFGFKVGLPTLYLGRLQNKQT